MPASGWSLSGLLQTLRYFDFPSNRQFSVHNAGQLKRGDADSKHGEIEGVKVKQKVSLLHYGVEMKRDEMTRDQVRQTITMDNITN
jgi:hypothetical protein